MSRIAIVAAAVAAAATLSGCAATPRETAAREARQARSAAELDQRLAGFTAGKPTTCLPNRNARRSDYFGDTIIYEVSGNLLYRTDTSGGCSLRNDDILVTRSTIGQLCRGDIAHTVDRASRFPTGSCALGEFTPYRKTRS
ncbi:hypothetical protein [Sphingomonas spermidinifaciens]|nr:hypothetical protein [Sphingomonas spermidinifaciens]